MGTNIEPSLVQRVVQGVRYVVTGVGPTNFFGPSQPLQPQAQDRTEGRAFDFPVGFNLRIRPREGEVISFDALRAIADGYDLLRLAIETRKDQIEAYDWEILPFKKEGDAEALKDDINAVTDFLQSPDREHDWSQWLRMQMEDLLVLDALAIYPRMDRGGKLYALELVDAATIKRVLDDGGRTPEPPSVAYQQVLKGIPAGDYSRDTLHYTMRNPRTNRIYGLSPVEQVLMTVNIAMRRQMSQLDFYTSGNVPEALAQAPEGWTAKQIQDFQLWWDSLMEGNSAQKRKMRFIPKLDNIVFPKDAVLKDEYDEWLARIICFAFSLSPSALVKQVNRASGEQMADTAKEEGLLPLLKFLESHMTQLLHRFIGARHLRFKFKVINKVDPVAQATIHGTYIDKQVMTPDEVREDLGMEAMTPEMREAAFPKPPAPVQFDADGNPIAPPEGADGAPAVGRDGKPLAGAAAAQPGAGKAPGKPGGFPPAKGKPQADDEEKPAEKALLAAIAELAKAADPARLADAMAQVLKAQPPTVIEHRPDISVEVGDTNVHVPRAEPAPAVLPAVEKVAEQDPQLTKRFVARRMADGSIAGSWEDRLHLVAKREPDGTLISDWSPKT